MTEALDIQRHGPIKRQVEKIRNRMAQTHGELRSERPRFKEQPHLKKIDLREQVNLEFVRIEPGKFMMGEAPTDDFSLASNALPVRLVKISKPFYLARTPVTQRQWSLLMGSNPSLCRFDNHPVEQVDWMRAQEFCIKVSKRINGIVRLPSESEWEYACRAGTTTHHYTGERFGAIDANLDFSERQAESLQGLNFNFESDLNLDVDTSNENSPSTTPIDAYPANPWGLFDMLGNVYEWCLDEWQDGSFHGPTDESPWIEEANAIYRVARGGDCNRNGNMVTPASRWSRRVDDANPFTGENQGIRQWQSFIGFRPVLEIT